jgi:small ligand-binding sensory domain FIST
MTVEAAEERRRTIVAEIGRLGVTAPGSITTRSTRCQTPGCRCRAEPAQLHGPYPTWIRRIDGKTITRTLHGDELERLRPLLAANHRLRQLVNELQEVSAELAEEALRLR